MSFGIGKFFVFLDNNIDELLNNSKYIINLLWTISGAFPFGFFATNFVNMGEGRGQGMPPEGSAQYEEEQFLHKAFLWVAFAFIFWLLIA